MSECSGCDVCGLVDDRKRFADVDGKHYCAKCWKKAGCPWPRRAMTTDEIVQVEIQARQRMLKRGAADRHMVRSGRT